MLGGLIQWTAGGRVVGSPECGHAVHRDPCCLCCSNRVALRLASAFFRLGDRYDGAGLGGILPGRV